MPNIRACSISNAAGGYIWSRSYRKHQVNRAWEESVHYRPLKEYRYERHKKQLQ